MLFLSLRPTLFLVQSRSFSGRHVYTGFLDPALGAMMKQVCWHSRRSKADRGLPEARMAELLWKKPPLRTSTCGRHRFRRNHPLYEPRMWQGQVWEARPDGESMRGKAKFGKRHGSRKWEEENSATRRRHRGRGGNGRKLPPPIQCATLPIGHPQGGLLSITLYFSNAGNVSAAIFWWFLASAVVLRKNSPASAASAGIRACIGRYVNQNGWFSGPCLATLLARWIEIARACNHLSLFKFSSVQYPLENYKLRNMVRFRAIFCLGYLSSVNVCNFIDDLGVSASIEISWLRYLIHERGVAALFHSSDLSQTTQVGQLSHSSS